MLCEPPAWQRPAHYACWCSTDRPRGAADQPLVSRCEVLPGPTHRLLYARTVHDKETSDVVPSQYRQPVNPHGQATRPQECRCIAIDEHLQRHRDRQSRAQYPGWCDDVTAVSKEALGATWCALFRCSWAKILARATCIRRRPLRRCVTV